MEMPLPPGADEKTQETANNITLTDEETKRLEECFRDKKFRDLLSEYVREISNPSTKLAYEQYLQQLESEGASPKNRKLMKPVPEFCIKAKLDKQCNSDHRHVFVNVCSGDLVKDAKLGHSSGFDHKLYSSGARKEGLCWQVPYILGHRRFDSEDGAIIFDIAFSPHTLQLSQKESSLRNVLIQTALEAIDNAHREYSLRLGSKSSYKILTSNRSKGKIEPPLMSVVVEEVEPQRLVNTTKNAPSKSSIGKKQDDGKEKEKVTTAKTKKQTISINSKEQMNNAKDIEYKITHHNDKQLGKQVFITAKLEQVTSISQISSKLDEEKGTLCISTKKEAANLYNKCIIDLNAYGVRPSSMTASWYKDKQELKITCGVRTVLDQDIDVDIDTTSQVVQHPRKPLHREFPMETRDRLDKRVLLIRVTNILEHTLDINFHDAHLVTIAFETHSHRYFKNINCYDFTIDVNRSRFDLNSRNLLVMLIKQ